VNSHRVVDSLPSLLLISRSTGAGQAVTKCRAARLPIGHARPVTAPRLTSPDALEQCLEALRRAEIEAGNVPSKSMVATEFLASFLSWHATTESTLGYLLTPASLHELLSSPRLWALRGMDSLAPSAREWAELELRARVAALVEARRTLSDAQYRWRRDGDALVMPDTNLLLHHDQTLLHIPWRQIVQARAGVRVVLPLKVIDELDAQKRTGKTHETRARARATLRELRSTSVVGTTRRHTLIEEEFAATTLEVLADDWGHQRLDDADLEIVDRAADLSDLAGRTVTLVTSDVGMEVRAGMADVKIVFIESGA
jgi:rRNA-processing protein FCF1